MSKFLLDNSSFSAPPLLIIIEQSLMMHYTVKDPDLQIRGGGGGGGGRGLIQILK